MPRFSLSYVDMDLIRTKVKEWSSQMKEFFNNHNKGYVFLNYDGNNRNVSTSMFKWKFVLEMHFFLLAEHHVSRQI